jgi:predicted anti-sigma-YlaC factor YlaD
MSCEYYQLNISKLLDNELTENESAELFNHMGSCGACREFFRKTIQIQSLMDELNVPEPLGLANPIMELAKEKLIIRPKISLYQKFREVRIPLSVAAAVVIIATAGTIALSSFYLRPSPMLSENTARTVYSYTLPTVYIQAPQKVQQ